MKSRANTGRKSGDRRVAFREALRPRPVDLVWLLALAAGVAMIYIGKPKAAFDSFILGGLILTLRLMTIPYGMIVLFAATASLQIVGEAAGWYGLWPLFDKITHILFPLVGALTLYEVLARYGISPRLGDLRNKHPRAHLFMLVFLLGVGAEAIWESMEFASDVFGMMPSALQHGNADTMVDIVNSLLGSALAGVAAVLFRRK